MGDQGVVRPEKLFIALLLLSVFVLFGRSFDVFFVQDDFFLLSKSQIQYVTDLLHIFQPLPEVVWYRPLSSQLFFWFGNTLFGHNPAIWHLFVFTTHIATAILLWRLVMHTTGKRVAAQTAAVVYVLHAVHVISLSWLATYSFIVGPFFIVASLLAYADKKFKWSLGFFVLGVLSTEVVLLFPLMLAAYQYFFAPQSTGFAQKLQLKRLTPYMIISVFFLWLRLVAFPGQAAVDAYTISVTQIVTTLRFYLLRIIGIPMLFRAMPPAAQTVTAITVVVLLGVFAYAARRLGARIFEKQMTFFALLGAIGLLPFLLLPFHVSPHYLSFALLGVAPMVGLMVAIMFARLSGKKRSAVIGVLVAAFLLLQAVGSFWTYRTHWIFQRARLAKQLVERGEFVHPVGSEEYFSLGAGAAQAVFGRE